MQIIEMAAMLLTQGAHGNRSFVPEYIGKTLANQSGRVFLIPENFGTVESNNEHFVQCFQRIRTEYGGLDGADRVFIDRSAEAGMLSGRKAFFEVAAEEAGIPLNQVHYISQNSKVALSPHWPGPRWVYFHHYAVSMSRRYRDVDHDCGYESAGPNILCLNRKIRPQRLAVAAEAKRLFGDRVILTWGGVDALYGHERAMTELREVLPSFAPVAARADLPVSSLMSDFNGAEGMPMKESSESFLHLVTESDYRHYSDRFTEKVLKPIAAHRPFIVFGPAGVLAKLRDHGFQTFDGIIDERYDTIADADERLRAVFHSLVDVTRKDHREVLEACRDICAHNQKNLRFGLEPYLAKRLAERLVPEFVS